MEARLVMIGLDDAGKTVLLYRLKIGEIVTTIPTNGFNVEMIEHKNMKFTIWDIGGSSMIRALWHQYYQNTDGIVFVIDSHDRGRMDDVCDAFQVVLSNEELNTVPLLIFANKQDLSDAMNTNEIKNKLKLHSISDRKWHIQAACACDGSGLYEGLDWLADQMKKE
ncbi:unnamed protein product [Adineta ricciae]|uniref:Uncharacterized protein n=1 Tax=Adineta ricciae TaxID=249248 RepID=A0A814ES11_ADIRI|nr:unnamed protein product [Adineta ricciae]CAF1271645.1 unnamed protein product [Adineta ricciae]